MTENRTKSIKLRAFNIKSTDISVRASDVLEKLKTKLPATKAKDRQMVLNSEDPAGEHDIMSDFSVQDNKIIFGTILRIVPNGNDEHIDATLFEKDKFSIEEIKKTSAGGAAIYKTHNHICLNDTHLITDLRYPNIVKGIETYINWLLESHIFEFPPIVVPKPEMKLSELKNITFSNPTRNNRTERKSFWFSKENLKSVVDYIFKDSKNLDMIDLEQLISAELILKLNKPKGMTDEEYQRKYSSILKPIADLESVSFKSKDGKNINAKDLMLAKTVDIETTNTGFVSENQLNIEMAKFLDEIKNAKDHT